MIQENQLSWTLVAQDILNFELNDFDKEKNFKTFMEYYLKECLMQSCTSVDTNFLFSSRFSPRYTALVILANAKNESKG